LTILYHTRSAISTTFFIFFHLRLTIHSIFTGFSLLFIKYHHFFGLFSTLAICNHGYNVKLHSGVTPHHTALENDILSVTPPKEVPGLPKRRRIEISQIISRPLAQECPAASSAHRAFCFVDYISLLIKRGIGQAGYPQQVFRVQSPEGLPVHWEAPRRLLPGAPPRGRFPCFFRGQHRPQ